MNVVFLCQRVPYPPDRGDRITTYHVLQHLLGRGARVRVGCFTEEARDLEAARVLSDRVTEVCAPRIRARLRKAQSLPGLLRGQALSLRYYQSAALARAIDRWMAEDPPDLVYLYSAFMAQYVTQHRGPVRFMQFAELDSDKWRQYSESSQGGVLSRFIYGREAKLLLAFEQHVARTFEVSGVVSEVERELFRRHIPEVDPVVLPNGVDVDHFRSTGDAQRHPHGVVFTGVMDYEPNIDGVQWFADECWEALRAEFPDAVFRIVGSRPTAAVQAMATRPGIEVTGRVPETPPYFDQASVAVAPLRLARGVQNKVLEAMSMGTAVVATPQAAQGLGQVPDDTLIVAEGSDATRRAVAALLGDPSRARAVGQRAAAWVRQHYRWEQVLAGLDRAIDPLLRGQPVQQ
ncbi:MAG: TIGR03087 family PEP-CTERM/XrtA system glycosyltransferase [Planctomycetota bacterium]